MTRPALLALAAAILAIVLAVRLADGSVFFLVQTWYEPLLVATTVVLGALGLAAARPLLRDRQGLLPRHVRVGGALGGLLIAAPIVLLVVLRPEPLGSSSIQVAGSDDGFLSNLAISGASPGDRNLFQWAVAFRTEAPATLAGQPVDLAAFVYRPDGAAPGQFLAARFVVACCVADARGVTLLVEWSDAAALPVDAWVRIEGEVALATSGEPFVRATSVERIDAPSSPYLYP